MIRSKEKSRQAERRARQIPFGGKECDKFQGKGRPSQLELSEGGRRRREMKQQRQGLNHVKSYRPRRSVR